MKTSLEQIISLLNNSPSTLFILCGLPYAGKTYFSKEMLANTTCGYVSINQILESQGYNLGLNKLPDGENWKRIMELSYQQIRDNLKAGTNVLYDSTNHTRASRDKLRGVAEEAGVDSVVIYLDVPVEVIRKRWEENKKSRVRFVLDERLFNETIEALEVPAEDEKAIILSGI